MKSNSIPSIKTADSDKFPLATGKPWGHIKQLMDQATQHDIEWTSEKNFIASYFAGDDVAFIAREAFNRHMGDNAIQCNSLHPALLQYEIDVLSFVQRLLNAPQDSTATLTTGGSESIMLAMKTARDRARELKPEVTNPEIILPHSAYPVFNKAADNLGINVVQMQTSPNYQADLEGIKAAINEHTIMLVGSAPPYPLAVVDPIPELAVIAEQHDLWLHIDTCIGGFVLPFAEALGRDIPTFDFRLPAVTSMSIDFHKYGYAMRGCSAVVLRDKNLESYQGYQYDAWPGGDYRSKNIAGSRPAGPLASAWAVLQYLGYEGLLERMQQILTATDHLVEGINTIENLYVQGKPEGAHIAFTSDTLDVHAIASSLEAKGWGISMGTQPAAIILMISSQHTIPVIDNFLVELENTINLVKSGKNHCGDHQDI